MPESAAYTGARNFKVPSENVEPTAAAYRAQADAAEIEFKAKKRLADEYDAAQERGEVSKQGQRTDILPDEKKVPTVTDLGLTHKEIHEARAAWSKRGPVHKGLCGQS